MHALVRDGVYASADPFAAATAAQARGRRPPRRADAESRASRPSRTILSRRRGPISPPRKSREALFRQGPGGGAREACGAQQSQPIRRTGRTSLSRSVISSFTPGGGRKRSTPTAARFPTAVPERDYLRALIGRAAANRLLAKLGDAFAALSEAEPRARAGAADRALAEIHYLRGNLHFARGELDSCRKGALSRPRRSRCGSICQEWRAHALSGLADAQYMDCRMATALKLFAECVELKRSRRIDAHPYSQPRDDGALSHLCLRI